MTHLFTLASEAWAGRQLNNTEGRVAHKSFLSCSVTAATLKVLVLAWNETKEDIRPITHIKYTWYWNCMFQYFIYANMWIHFPEQRTEHWIKPVVSFWNVWVKSLYRGDFLCLSLLSEMLLFLYMNDINKSLSEILRLETGIKSEDKTWNKTFSHQIWRNTHKKHIDTE